MSKYTDLMRRIDRDKGFAGREYHAAWLTLSWLDNHPEEVPGRTITEGGFDQISQAFTDTEKQAMRSGFFHAGGNIVPDPEPTNAELLEYLYSNWSQSDLNPPFGEWADSIGVTAPEKK